MSDEQSNQMREILNGLVTEKKLQERIQRYLLENETLGKERQSLRKSLTELQEVHDSMVKALQSDLKEMTGLKVRAEAQVRVLESEIQQKVEYYESSTKKIIDDHNAELDRLAIDIQKLRTANSDLNEFKINKAEYEKKMQQLEEDYDKEKKQHTKDVDELERERIKATEKLKKDMLYKIKETREHVMALNDEQLHTTTRFTILENHRLTTELEYQSKQTEKLMNRNTQLEEQAASFKRDIDIHKQVESELAKRSHYCQKIIKKLNSKVKELEDEILNNKKITITQGDDLDIRQDSKMSEELVRFLENKLEESMSRLAQVQMEYNVLKADYTEMQQKLKEKSEKYRNLGCLLADYLNDLKNLAPGLNQEDELTLNMHKLSANPIDKLSPDDRQSLIIALLKQIQPFISPSNLSIPNVSSINIISTPAREDSLPSLSKKLPTASIGVQTSFALGTFELPKLDIDAEMVKSSLRPWGTKVAKSTDSSFIKRQRKYK